MADAKMHDFLEQSYGTLAATLYESLAWWGQALLDVASARSILMSAPPLRSDEATELAEFYAGNQWPAVILAQREGRPCIVANRLPELVAAAIDRHRAEGYEELTQAEVNQLELVTTKRNRDPQMLYNYLLSAIAEIVASHKVQIDKTE